MRVTVVTLLEIVGLMAAEAEKLPGLAWGCLQPLEEPSVVALSLQKKMVWRWMTQRS
jgi:hypothetical protein